MMDSSRRSRVGGSRLIRFCKGQESQVIFDLPAVLYRLKIILSVAGLHPGQKFVGDGIACIVRQLGACGIQRDKVGANRILIPAGFFGQSLPKGILGCAGFLTHGNVPIR